MSMVDLLFVLCAGLTVVSATLVLVFRNLLHAAVSLFFCLAGVAGLYILLGADFLGVSQLLIYAGGILVLLIFGIFLTANMYDPRRVPSPSRGHWLLGLGCAGAFFVLVWMLVWQTDWPTIEPGVREPTIRSIGELLLTKYLLPFELISVLLLFAMVGAAILVRKEMRGN